MPVQREQFYISSQDLSKNVGIGVKIPFSKDTVFQTTYTSQEQTKCNLINFLLSNEGDRPFSNFGANLRTYLFDQMVDEDELKSILEAKIYGYIQNISIQDIIIEKIEEENSLIIKIYYFYNNNKDQVVLKLG